MGKNFGLAFPIQLEDGHIKAPDLKTSIESNIRVALFWPPGTRAFNTPFSLDLTPIIGEPNDSLSETVLRKMIFKAISRYEPRAEILSTDIRGEGETVKISLHLRVRDTQEIIYMEV